MGVARPKLFPELHSDVRDLDDQRLARQALRAVLLIKEGILSACHDPLSIIAATPQVPQQRSRIDPRHPCQTIHRRVDRLKVVRIFLTHSPILARIHTGVDHARRLGIGFLQRAMSQLLL